MRYQSKKDCTFGAEVVKKVVVFQRRMPSGYQDWENDYSGLLPICHLGGRFVYSFRGSMLELINVEAQRGLGFGMRIKGQQREQGRCTKGELGGRAVGHALGIVTQDSSGTSFVLPRGLFSFFDAPGEMMGVRPGICRPLS